MHLLNMNGFFISFRHVLILVLRSRGWLELYLWRLKRRIWIDTDWSIIEEPWVREWVVSVRYTLRNTYSGVSGLIQTKLLLRNLEFESELYLYDTDEYRGCISVDKILENTKGYTWIGTDLRKVNGVRLLLLTKVNRDRNIFSLNVKQKATLFTSRCGPSSSPSFKYIWW